MSLENRRLANCGTEGGSFDFSIFSFTDKTIPEHPSISTNLIWDVQFEVPFGLDNSFSITNDEINHVKTNAIFTLP